MSNLEKQADTSIECPECGLTIGFHLNTLIESAQERGLEVTKPDKIQKALPIYFKDTESCVGTMHFENGKLYVSLFDGYAMTKDEIFNHFGNITFVTDVKYGESYSSFTIEAYSIDRKIKKPIEDDSQESQPQ